MKEASFTIFFEYSLAQLQVVNYFALKNKKGRI